LPVGVSFPPRIEQAIDSSDAVIAVIGPQWISRDATPETDWCMREILRAHTRGGGPIPIVPLLHARAKYPTVDDLPPELGFLPFLGGAEILTTRPADEEIAALETRLAILEREIVTARRTPERSLGGVLLGLSTSPPLTHELRSAQYSQATVTEFATIVAESFLELGADLAYAGLPVVREWTPENSMTFALTKLARRVRPEPGAGRDRVLNYLPPHVPRPPDLPDDTFGYRYPAIANDAPVLEGAAAVAVGLWSMRRSVTADVEALVCIGGKAAGYRGRMPGVFEEVMVALIQHVPVYLLGGLGGATWFIAEQIRGEPPDELTLRGQLVGQMQQTDLALAEGKPPLPDYAELIDRLALTAAAVSYSDFRRVLSAGWDPLRNGLTGAENEELCDTISTGVAVNLIATGLQRLRAERSNVCGRTAP
jgi:SLOG cluster2